MLPLYSLPFLITYLLIAECRAKQAEQQQHAEMPKPSNPVKDVTAGGRYNAGGGGYSSEKSGEYEYAYGSGHRLVDDYICDLDASILVVTNSEKGVKKDAYGGNNYGDEKKDYGGGSYVKESYAGGRGAPVQAAVADVPAAPAAPPQPKRSKRDALGRVPRDAYQESGEGYGGDEKDYGGYGKKRKYNVAKAHRLRCSHIAVNSDEDCRKCCHMAARKERSISKETIVGFIVDYDEMRQPSSADYLPHYRRKREAYAPAMEPPADYGYGQSYNYNYNYPKKPKNARCVCCAPKTYKGSYDDHKEYGKDEESSEEAGYGGNSYERSEYKHRKQQHHHHKGHRKYMEKGGYSSGEY